jgi:hypothetical protein
MHNIPIEENKVMPGIRKLLKGECFKTLSTVIPRSLPEGSTIMENPAARAFKPVTISRIIPTRFNVLDDFIVY